MSENTSTIAPVESSNNNTETKVAVPSEENTISKTAFWLLTITLFLCVIANGLADTMRSVTYPLMKTDLNLTYVEYGALESMGQFSYLIWACLTAIMIQYVGFKTPFILAFVVNILGCVGTAFTDKFWLIMITQFIGTNILGALDDGPSALAVILFTKNPAGLYCVMSGMYGLGAFLGPLLSGWIHHWKPEYSYHAVTLLMCIPIALIGLYVLCVPFAIRRPQTKPNSSINVWSCLRSPLIWYCAIMLNFMATAERGTLSWGTMYVKDVLHLTDEDGAALNSRFYFCFMLARFVGGFITDRVGPFKMEYIIIPIGTLIYVIGFLAGKTGIYILPFLGFFVSLFWPTFIIAYTHYWGKESSIPVACLLPLQSLVGMVIQYGLGVMNERYGPQYAYWMSVPGGLLGLLMFIYFHILTRRKEKKEQEALLNGEVYSICLRPTLLLSYNH